MTIKTPAWYYQKSPKAPWWRFVLYPLSALWLWALRQRFAKAKPVKSSVKVISVGNLTVGGSGKSPIAQALCQALIARGHRAVILSRGHGGTLFGPVRVDPLMHTAKEVGDEPLMLSAHVPVVIARKRALGINYLESLGFSHAVLDDAHQNPDIIKDFSIVVVDALTDDGAWPFGDEAIFPAGPLREPIDAGLKRADHIVFWCPNADYPLDEGLTARLSSLPSSCAYLSAKPAPKGRYIGFAGIAKPWKFAETLRSQGLEIVAFHAFGDHETLSQTQFDSLKSKARAQKARLITTEKDIARLMPYQRGGIEVLRIEAKFLDDTLIERLTSL